MKVYIFTFGYSSETCSYEEIPIFEEHAHINKEKAFARLMELNKSAYEKNDYKGNLENFCKEYCVNSEPPIGCYAMNELIVKE